MVDSWSTLHMQGAMDEPLWSCSCTRTGTFPPFLGMSFSFGVDEVGEKVHDSRTTRQSSVSTASGVARVAWPCASCVPPSDVLFVLWCLDVALLLVSPQTE
jgi:hypothetical protein